MPIKLNGATSGSVELDVPAAVGSDLQLTLPATAGEVIVKAADGSVDLGDVDIDSSGNVTVNTANNALINLGNTSQQHAEIKYTHSGQEFLDIKSIGSTSSWGNIRFYTGTDVERMRIDNSGRLLVGTSTARTNYYATTDAQTPVVQLEASRGGLAILGTGNGSDLFIGKGSSVTAANDFLGEVCFTGFDGTNNRTAARILCQTDGACGPGDMPGRLVFSTCADGASSPTERMRIGSSGIIHFGSTAVTHPTYFFAPDSGGGTFVKDTNSTDSRTAFIFRISGTQVGSITTSGSATAYNTSSDYRLKENVVDIADGITRVKQLQPKRFNFIADVNKTVDGFLAHEAQVVVPEAVTGEKDGEDMQGIDQSKLVPLLTAALQEAIAKIETLEQRLTDAGIA